MKATTEDILIKLLKEVKKQREESLPVIKDIDRLIKKVVKENKKFGNEYYWKWESFMDGWKEIKKRYIV